MLAGSPPPPRPGRRAARRRAEAVARADSKSAVSRRFRPPPDRPGRAHRPRLSTLDVAALMIGRITFADCCCVAASSSPPTAPRCPSGCGTATPRTAPSSRTCSPMWSPWSALRRRHPRGHRRRQSPRRRRQTRALREAAVVQRCVLHKRRDVAGYLDPILARAVDCQLARPFNDTDWQRGRRVALWHRHPARRQAPLRGGQPARRTGGHVHRAPPRGTRPAGPVPVVHQRHRVDDLGRVHPHPGRSRRAGLSVGVFFAFSSSSCRHSGVYPHRRGIAAMQAINRQAPSPLFMTAVRHRSGVRARSRRRARSTRRTVGGLRAGSRRPLSRRQPVHGRLPRAAK